MNTEATRHPTDHHRAAPPSSREIERRPSDTRSPGPLHRGEEWDYVSIGGVAEGSVFICGSPAQDDARVDAC